KSVQNYTSVFNEEADCLAKVLCSKDPTVAINVYVDVVETTTQIYRQIFEKMTLWWLQIPVIYWLVGAKKTEDHYLRIIDEFSSDVVRRRQRCLQEAVGDEETLGVVDRYIISEELSEQEIKWETFSLFTTSQEASAKIASGVLMFLAHLPEWQDRVYNEIIEILGPQDSPVSSEQVKQLKYLDMVYMETLRYFSIAAMIQRTVEEEITINE
ncbi:Uncharacterized protein OBRU01_05927, partial [Operophtera brumata]